MFVMDAKSLTERDVLIDLEGGIRSVINGGEASGDGGSSVRKAKRTLNRVWNGFVGVGGSIRDEESVYSGGSTIEGSLANGGTLVDKRFGGEEKLSLLENKTRAQKPKKEGSKRPPKLPKPPKSPSLDAADQKLIREISELAMLKKARIERMKALKKMKNAKSTSSSSNLVALIITALFCLVIIWQGFFSRGSSSLSFQGSPGSSVGKRTGLISVQFYNNGSEVGLHDSSSASLPRSVAGLDGHGETSRGAG
ncbi:uncharacterized protein LOC103698405 [Phoenix dactylifera]|uniref:Uncharacterized protein LOC103698405 n=1 Tax=Phoenix dactylifera TaxID=42345 RepID=A0A8B7BJM7_PHODC|nr:uncharacterized protein LOC103698405 [Phoenix dactylifera]XP_008778629.1 uncharacterized protein LOC103698405 [Phoenix dactylifera]XP_038988829.1 uncharacterized protein LOC103698405 [Phoenix dactylifera]